MSTPALARSPGCGSPLALARRRRRRTTGVVLGGLLATLVVPGLVQYHQVSGRYGLGIRILQLAGAARETLDIRRIARPSLPNRAGAFIDGRRAPASCRRPCAR